MPSMMGNQPMKDSYVGGLEKSLAKKMKPMPPRKPVKRSGPMGQYPMDAKVRGLGKFGM